MIEIQRQRLDKSKPHAVMHIFVSGFNSIDNRPTRIGIRVFADDEKLMETIIVHADMPITDALVKNSAMFIQIPILDALCNKPSVKVVLHVGDYMAYMLLSRHSKPCHNLQRTWINKFYSVARRCCVPVTLCLDSTEFKKEILEYEQMLFNKRNKTAPTLYELGVITNRELNESRAKREAC